MKTPTRCGGAVFVMNARQLYCIAQQRDQAAKEVSRMTTAWLIEDRFAPGPRWWHGAGYSSDANEAVRFARKVDAQRVILTTLLNEDFPLIATEHGWYEDDSHESK